MICNYKKPRPNNELIVATLNNIWLASTIQIITKYIKRYSPFNEKNKITHPLPGCKVMMINFIRKNSINSNKLAAISTFFFLLLPLSNTYAANFCAVIYGDSNTLKYTVNANEVSSSTAPGSVVGTLTYSDAYFDCPGFSQSGINVWRLSILPNAPVAENKNTVCTTNIKGIGIEYYNQIGTPIACNSIYQITAFTRTSTNRKLNAGQLMARLIRLSGELDSNGTHSLILNASLNQSFDNSASTSWGSISNAGSDIINVSNYTPLIYFPSSQNNQPVVHLDIKRKLPGTKQNSVSSTSNLDMCLYDGNNSSSSSIKLIFRDEGNTPSDRGEGLFSIYRQGADRNLVENRIDYSVSVINPTNNSRQKLNNGEGIFWSNTNDRRILRQVALPNIPGISLCVPAPLTFDTGNFNISEKNAGQYLGILTVLYTPNT